MNKRIRQEIFERFRAANPHSTIELSFNSPFELLIAVLLSAQATNMDVGKATTKLSSVAATPRAMLDLGLDGVMERAKTIGLYKAKSRHIMQTCRILLEKYHGEMPADRSALRVLPGVGRKTTNVMLNTMFGQPVVMADTHVFRISNRIKIAPDKGAREVEDKLMHLVPEEFLMDAHHWFILHGHYICKALKP